MHNDDVDYGGMYVLVWYEGIYVHVLAVDIYKYVL